MYTCDFSSLKGLNVPVLKFCLILLHFVEKGGMDILETAEMHTPAVGHKK